MTGARNDAIRNLLIYRWVYYITLSEINQGVSLASLMKSCVARWNPRKLGWNLRRAASDEIKSASSITALAGFHRVAISSTAGGFLPPTADLVEKSTHCLGRQMCAFFWWGMVDSDHRSQWQQIYSLPPLAAREIPHIGAGERSRTINLLITNQLLCHWATPAYVLGSSDSFLLLLIGPV